MTLPASIRVNVRAPFPSRVQGQAFIQVSKANGVYTIAPNYTILQDSVGLSANQILALFNTVTGTWSYIPATELLSALSVYRIVTVPGAVEVLPTDVTILFQKTSSGASSLLLPESATRSGVPVKAKDLTYDAQTNNVTFTPFTGETIDGFSAATSVANGAALIQIDGGFKTLYPLEAGGWYSA